MEEVKKGDTKANRKQCYSSRDAYWKCLDKTSAKLGETKCKHLREDYETFCHPSWVSHFDNLRLNELATRKYALYDPVDSLPPVRQSPEVEAKMKKTFVPFD
ncbi:cytochrome c oxidase assembly factor 6 homolog [Argopecten irradians]|uniref:cytochrome c oxidase assembly factor 6 homolog n=1 Tax=Argopecten irradians TaxID=31199 RepID=UPI003721BB79